MLIGSVVASTDAAAVFAVLRRAPLPRRLTALLEVESGANDPMAIMLTIGALETLRRSPAASEWVAFAVLQLAAGVLIGVAVAWLGSQLLSRSRLGAAGLYPVLAASVAGLAYGLAAAAGSSGFLAVYVAGLVVGARVPRHRRSIRTFHDGLASAAGIGLFLMLGILVFPSDLPGVAPAALGVTAVLVFVARPVAVVLCLVWFGYRWRELVLVSWAGLRGAVPIVLATFPLAAGFPEGQLIFNVGFFAVLISSALQGREETATDAQTPPAHPIRLAHGPGHRIPGDRGRLFGAVARTSGHREGRRSATGRWCYRPPSQPTDAALGPQDRHGRPGDGRPRVGRAGDAVLRREGLRRRDRQGPPCDGRPAASRDHRPPSSPE